MDSALLFIHKFERNSSKGEKTVKVMGGCANVYGMGEHEKISDYLGKAFPTKSSC